jgi:AraC-like DNA-binding protein
MHYEEHPPPAGLARHVECLWVFQAESGPDRQRHHVIVPDGAVSISCMLAPNGIMGATVVGPSDQAHRSDLIEGAVYAGVRLRPGAAGSILHRDIAALRGQVQRVDASLPDLQPAADLMLRGPGDLIDRLAGAAGLLAAESAPLDEAVLDFASAISDTAGGEPLSFLARDACIGTRQLRRRFVYQCGVSPKLFSRLRRLREVCRTILASRAPDLSQAAVEAGFADQAHMTNEFTRVFGESALLAVEYLATIRHGAFLQSEEEAAA